MLLGAWLLISMPAARAILASRAAFYLRAMPVPASTVIPVLTAFMGHRPQCSRRPIHSLW